MSSSILLQELENGRASLLLVRAQPGAKRAGCAGAWNGMLKVAVTERALDGRANRAIVELIAELFGLSRAAVELVGGERSRNKKVRLEAPPAYVQRRLAELVP